MRNFMNGVLALWTVLTTICTIVTFGLIGCMIECLCDEKEDKSNIGTRRPVSYTSYRDRTN